MCQAVSSRWITDLRASYQFRRIRVAVNVANFFDAYPNEWPDFKNGANAQGASVGGTFRYSGVGTFGTDGRMVSLQFSYRAPRSSCSMRASRLRHPCLSTVQGC